jgi:phosphoglycolate phosphatase
MWLQAILFDLDGTLLDTLADLADAANRVLDRAGLPTHPHSAYRRFIGDGSRLLITRALPEDRRDSSTVDVFLDRFKADYGANWKSATRPYPGVVELLREFSDRSIPQAVVTNKPQLFAERCIAHFFPKTAFRMIRGQEGNRPLKPDPAPALDVARYLQVLPEACLLLGDSGVDMQTARAASMLPLGAAWGFRSEEELMAAGAARIARHPRDVLEWFRQSELP